MGYKSNAIHRSNTYLVTCSFKTFKDFKEALSCVDAFQLPAFVLYNSSYEDPVIVAQNRSCCGELLKLSRGTDKMLIAFCPICGKKSQPVSGVDNVPRAFFSA